LTQGLKFRPRTNEFLKKLKDDEKKIDTEENIIVKADKTSNRCVMKKEDYVKLRDENIQTVYKKLRNVMQEPQHVTHIDIQLKACLVLVKG
jgi:anion-transporting  ArsA/GET3 family ATPase